MRIALVDLSAIYWTSWHAAPDGEVTAAYNVTRQRVHDLLADYDSVAVCLDAACTWRREAFPAYKANREAKPAGAVELLGRIIDELRSQCHVLGCEGYEADDVIATACHLLASEHDIDIVSSDKDLWQCLGPRVRQVRLNGKVMTPADLAPLRPEQVPDWLALMGDTSDNLPGVDGVGDVKARRMLEAYGTLEGVIDAALEKLPGFTKKATDEPTAVCLAVRASTKRDPTVAAVRDLAKLRTDVPIDCSVITVPTKKETDPMSDDIEDMTDSEPPPATPSAPEPPKSDERASQRGAEEPRAMVVRAATFERQLEPVSQVEAWKLAGAALASGLFRFRNREAVFMAIVAGRSYGLDSVQSLVGIHIIEGKPSLSSGLIHALCLRHPACEYFQMVESSDTVATFETKRRGSPSATRYSFTIDKAKRAGLVTKDNWKKYPEAMLRARCVAELARAVYPDAVHNTYLADELGADVAEVA